MQLDKNSLIKEYLKSKNPAVKEKLVIAYTPLIQYIVKKMSYNRLEFEDLLQVGTIGFLRSLDRFDPKKEVDFATFATPNIIGEIKHYFRDRYNLMNIPRKLQELYSKIKKYIRIHQVEGKSPTIKEIANALDVEEEKIIEAIEAKQSTTVISLDSPTSNPKNPSRFSPEGNKLIDNLRSEHDENFFLDKISLNQAIQKLAPKYQKLIYLRFFSGLSQSEIAKELEMSQMHVSRLLNKTVARLKILLKKGK
ncbi:sigma-70 family RNA polymerase sigma factor [Candidatus Margulisiibacteriota bacterium]